jgi:large subunit ribosomal protein L31
MRKAKKQRRPAPPETGGKDGQIAACQGGGRVVGFARFLHPACRLQAVRNLGKDMKKDIHPKYDAATISCACGHVLKTRSTVKSMSVNTCAACHPYFTGQAKFIDTEGRVDRFNKRYARKTAAKK